MHVLAVLFLLALVFGKAFFFDNYSIHSKSMAPGLVPGDMILVQKWGYGTYGVFGLNFIDRDASASINRGDVIVFEVSNQQNNHWVKRVLGLPGDTVEIDTPHVTINDMPVPTTLLAESGINFRYQQILGSTNFEILTDRRFSGSRPKESNGKWTVPQGSLFVVGDNRDNSNDSRYLGFISVNDLIGKVLFSDSESGDPQ